MANDLEKQKKNSVRLKDGREKPEEDVIKLISSLRMMDYSHKEIADMIGIEDDEMVRRLWHKLKKKREDALKKPNTEVIAEALEMFSTLRIDAFEALKQHSMKKGASLYVSLLKVSKDMVLEEVKFKERVGLIKPLQDRISMTIKHAENLSLNELKAVVNNIKDKIISSNLSVDKQRISDDCKKIIENIKNQDKKENEIILPNNFTNMLDANNTREIGESVINQLDEVDDEIST